ncbi:translation elongation factor G domain protein [Anaplasma phagocytophilum str. ApNYW]|nr:translation elongation factor G domain protein [Anaplasma phagocytophilum str. ApNYW]
MDWMEQEKKRGITNDYICCYYMLLEWMQNKYHRYTKAR